MSIRLHLEMENLKKSILSLGAAVEEALHRSIQALDERNEKLARKVIETDHEIDQMEVDLEEECLKLLALHQPVATDLRFIIAVLKINSDLERIGDLAVNIAEVADLISLKPKTGVNLDFKSMSDVVKKMLKKSLDSLVNLDAQLACEVLETDDEVDAMKRQMYILIRDAILENPDQIEGLIFLLITSRHLERIADHTTNISQDVIYMVEGKIVRHRTEPYWMQKK
jgi:phosphate transport system protein